MADDETLSPSESTDSDEVRNDDGDTVVDPPDDWSEADKFGMTAREAEGGESLDDKVAAEQPDVLDRVAPDGGSAAPGASRSDRRSSRGR